MPGARSKNGFVLQHTVKNAWSTFKKIRLNLCIGENAMKLNEDWLATILAFVLLILALIGVISPSWMKF